MCIALIQAGFAGLVVALGTKAALGPDQSPLIGTASAMVLVIASNLMFVQTMKHVFNRRSF